MSSKKPSIAVVVLFDKSSANERKQGRAAVHCPTLAERAPGAISDNFSRPLLGLRMSTKLSGMLECKVKEKDASCVLEMTLSRKSPILGYFVPISIVKDCKSGVMYARDLSKPIGVSAFHVKEVRLGRMKSRGRKSSKIGKTEGATLLIASTYVIL